jgi:hypothetical protein
VDSREAQDHWVALGRLPGVAEALSSAHEAVTAASVDRGLRRRLPDVVREVTVRGAVASAALEGVVVPVADLRSGTLAAAAEPGRTGLAALRVGMESARMVPVWRRAPRQAVARLHTVACADLVAAGASQATVGRPRGDLDEELRSTLLFTLDEAGRGSGHALVRAAVVAAEIAANEPFGWGSGLVSRGAADVVLRAAGLDQFGVLSIAVGHLESGGYASALARYRAGTASGVADWIVHVAHAVQRSAEDAVSVAAALA